MKRQDNFGVGGSIVLTVIFAGMAFYSYQIDKSSSSLAWIPGIGVIVGVIMTIIASDKASKADARKKQQEDFAKSIKYDSSFGNGDLKLYFDSTSRKVTICATTTTGTKEKIIDNFINLKSVETDNYIVSLDSFNNKVIKVKNNNGDLDFEECSINEKLKEMCIEIKPSTPTLKAFNDYAFVTDDINEYVAIVTPTKIYVHRYSDIVSISYEENGSDVFNKSLGGAVVGGLLFGGVGAIVGGNTAKTTQNKEVRIMTIKILLKSTSDSTIILKIFEAGKDGSILETKNAADKMHYEGLMKEVSGIKDIFSIIIDIVDKNIAMQKNPLVGQPQASTSVADELTKLLKLKESGILTEEEFNVQKSKLLNQ